MNKRVSARAIIIKENQIVLIKRVKKDRVYYVYPGGGLEPHETITECAIREVKEELGINIKVNKEKYIYESADSLQHFFLCEWVDGELGSGLGDGTEFVDQSRGEYIPMLVDTNKIIDLPLMPPEVTNELIKDLKNNDFNKKIRKVYKKVD